MTPLVVFHVDSGRLVRSRERLSRLPQTPQILRHSDASSPPHLPLPTYFSPRRQGAVLMTTVGATHPIPHPSTRLPPCNLSPPLPNNSPAMNVAQVADLALTPRPASSVFAGTKTPSVPETLSIDRHPYRPFRPLQAASAFNALCLY